jgi:hypothetical protein
MPAPTRRVVALLVATLASLRCGGLSGDPPEVAPIVKGPDGQRRHLVDRGRYRAFYDRWGRLERIEHDSNGDSRPDRITRHAGTRSPYRVEIDENFDGQTDRWEDFTSDGKLHRYAFAEQDGRPRMWTVVGPDGAPMRYEYDRDVDGRTERAEIVEGGLIARVELDTDHNGAVDRWQEWKGGRLQVETLDTDADGRADRRLRYGPGGVTGVERLTP